MATLRRTFRSELRDFLCFVWRPRLAPRLPARRLGKGWRVDWTVLPRGKRLVQWAIILWLFNAFLFGPLAAMAAGAGGADRKSTRLNSSHVAISYAVFCLKKKKQRERRRDE